MAPQVEFVRSLSREIGLSFLEGRKRRPSSSPQRVAVADQGPKQACVYRYYQHSDVVQVNPVSATEERVFTSNYEVTQMHIPERKSIALAY
ncbi:hypothetical protein A4A49_20915 [Nicotiana attenuata]|uniref:Uncharacterized protein n=1 Tax=Nicotiana attenuata TaxID=49451 RepID=A0A314KJ37_NICAT|nr:hypothetical protein A4A49_20915 [Nicotiana attenuata]